MVIERTKLRKILAILIREGLPSETSPITPPQENDNDSLLKAAEAQQNSQKYAVIILSSDNQPFTMSKLARQLKFYAETYPKASSAALIGGTALAFGAYLFVR